MPVRAAHSQTSEAFDPEGHAAESIRSQFLLVFAVAAIIFGLIGGSLLVFVMRFRERDIDSDTEPPQIQVPTSCFPSMTTDCLSRAQRPGW